MESFSHLVKVSIPDYLAGLPIPNSIGGWFRLGVKDWLSLIPPTAMMAGLGYMSYKAFCPRARPPPCGLVNPKIQKNSSKVVDMIDIENIDEKAAFCRCWRSENFSEMARKKSSRRNEDTLLLLEGDISEIDLTNEVSEEEMIRLIHRKGVLKEPYEEPQIHSTCKIRHKIEKMSTETDSDTEDDTPLSDQLRKRSLRWKRREISTANVNCNIRFARTVPEITALRYFKQFFTNELIHQLTDQTNLYSFQKSGTSIHVTEKEIEQFLGIHILSGIVKVSNVRTYWSDSTRFSIIADSMSEKRFTDLRTYIHFNDNSKIELRNNDKYDRLFKIRPFIDILKRNLSRMKNEEYHSINEVIIHFEDHSSPADLRSRTCKHQKYNCPYLGFKMFTRCGKSGILYDFDLDLGKNVLPSTSGLGLKGDIVLRLCKNLPSGENYKVLLDSKFNSHCLIVALKERGLLVLGTIRLSKLPKCVFKRDEHLKGKGKWAFDYRIEQSTKVIALKWLGANNHPVYLASSYCSILPLKSIKSWSSKKNKYCDISVPHLLFEYNENIGGVDLHNMLVDLYRIDIKAKKYYLRVIFNLIDSCVVNSWLLYRRHSDLGSMECKSLRDFRSEIAYNLLQTRHEH